MKHDKCCMRRKRLGERTLKNRKVPRVCGITGETGGADSETIVQLEFKLKTIEGNVAVFLWIKQARVMGIPISGALIMAKANSLAEKLNICDFKANCSWLYHFKIRRPMIYKMICGESASVTPKMTGEWRRNTLPTLLATSSNDDVNKFGQSGFYKCLPNKTYTLKGENASRNRKESKVNYAPGYWYRV